MTRLATFMIVGGVVVLLLGLSTLLTVGRSSPPIPSEVALEASEQPAKLREAAGERDERYRISRGPTKQSEKFKKFPEVAKGPELYGFWKGFEWSEES